MTQPRNFSMAGAVDLGARQAAIKRRQQAAHAGGGGESAFVFEVTDETFNTDVVARSRAVPVVVDLWAEWCEPCKQLGPVLERLATDAAGDWVLAKVDVDANPQLSAALQVQSIPMVVAVIGGQLVDGFLGALPEADLRQWIAQVLSIADQLGMPARVRATAETGAAGAEANGGGPGGQAGAAAAGAAAAGAGAAGAAGANVPGEAGIRNAGPGGAGTGGAAGGRAAGGAAARGAARLSGPEAELLADPRLNAAQQAMEMGDLNGAANALSQVLADHPDHPIAKAWLAQVELIRRVSAYDKAKVHRAAKDQPENPLAQAEAADLELANGDVEASFDRMLGVIARTSGQDRDAARVHLLGLFDLLPPRDPRVIKARGRLSGLLF